MSNIPMLPSFPRRAPMRLASRPAVLALAFAALTALACGRADAPPPPPVEYVDTTANAPGAPAVQVLTFGKSGPVEQAGYQPEFLAFRNEMMRVAQAHDTTALYAMLAPDIKASFGGDGGLDGFRRVWRPGAPDSELWDTLFDVLLHGGRFTNDETFTAPWTSFGLPDSLDAFTYLIVRGADVPVFAEPDSTGTPIASLGYDIVRRQQATEPSGWQAIALSNGEAGYVTANQVRSPVDARAIFEKRNGKWWLVLFLAGD